MILSTICINVIFYIMYLGLKIINFIHICHMMNMSVIMVGDECRGVRRVRRGVLEWGNNQKGYLGVRMGVYMYVLCVHGRENSRHVIHGIGEGSEGAKMIRDG